MSEKETEAKPKRLMETSEPQEAEEEEKRSTRKKPRIDYNEEKKIQAPLKDDSKAAKASTESEPSKASKASDDDDIQEVTPSTSDAKPKSDAGNSPLKSTEEKPEEKSDDLLGLPVEQTGLEGAAFQSRMPFDKMTQVEAACFPDLVTPLQSQKLYLHIRNRLLQMWLENPKQQLVSKDALKRLEAPWDSDEALVRNPIVFLGISFLRQIQTKRLVML